VVDVASSLVLNIAAAFEPIYDIVSLSAPDAVRRFGLLDVAPAAGFDLAIVGTVAAVVAIVLVLIVRSRRR
jgi:hypothetical protein